MTCFNTKSIGSDVVAAFAGAVKDKTFVITGPSEGGLGAETALSLAAANPRQLILVGRSKASAEAVMSKVKATSFSTDVRFVRADFADLASVSAAAETICSVTDAIDVLINNAGVMNTPKSISADNLELQFATNHLAHFVLTETLADRIRDGGRIVILSSLGHRFSDIRWDDINFELAGSYSPEIAYGQSKTANILHASELARRLEPRSICVFSLDPGSIATNLQRYITAEERQRLIGEMKRINPGFSLDERKSLQQGCATTLVAALDPTLQGKSGAYLSDCQVAQPTAYASDKEAAQKLWKISEEMVGGARSKTSST